MISSSLSSASDNESWAKVYNTFVEEAEDWLVSWTLIVYSYICVAIVREFLITH